MAFFKCSKDEQQNQSIQEVQSVTGRPIQLLTEHQLESGGHPRQDRDNQSGTRRRPVTVPVLA